MNFFIFAKNIGENCATVLIFLSFWYRSLFGFASGKALRKKSNFFGIFQIAFFRRFEGLLLSNYLIILMKCLYSKIHSLSSNSNQKLLEVMWWKSEILLWKKISKKTESNGNFLIWFRLTGNIRRVWFNSWWN